MFNDVAFFVTCAKCEFQLFLRYPLFYQQQCSVVVKVANATTHASARHEVKQSLQEDLGGAFLWTDSNHELPGEKVDFR